MSHIDIYTWHDMTWANNNGIPMRSQGRCYKKSVVLEISLSDPINAKISTNVKLPQSDTIYTNVKLSQM